MRGGGDDGEAEIEYDCEEVVRIEPLPRGTYPAALVGEWDCESSDGSSSTQIISSDGTFFLELSPGDYPSEVREIRNQCGIGTSPPDIAGHWIVDGTRMCLRYDVMPGIIACGPFRINQLGEWISSPSDVIEFYQYGRLVTSSAIGSIQGGGRCVKR